MVELFKFKGISFTNSRNKTGPRIDLCSTPCLTGFGSDVICPSFTNCRHPSWYDWNHATLSGLAPYTDNFFNNRLWSIMSKALWKSTNTSRVSSSLSTLNKILSVILISFKNGMNYQNGRLIVIFIEKANYCSLEDILKRLCFMLLRILDRFGSTDMGR